MSVDNTEDRWHKAVQNLSDGLARFAAVRDWPAYDGPKLTFYRYEPIKPAK